MHYSVDMSTKRMRWGIALLAIAGVYFLLVYVVPIFPASTRDATAFGGCIHRQQHLIAKGQSPSGGVWTVGATIQNNGSCSDWRLGMEFDPSGASRGRWSGAWGIPSGGHLSASFTIGAQDEAAGTERAFSGVVGVRVKTLALTTSSGERFTIHPKLPPKRLLKRFVWLRNLRYFVRYYPTGQPLKSARLLNSRSEVIYVARGEEGGFNGPL